MTVTKPTYDELVARVAELEHERQEGASFPERNPNPVVEVGLEGRVSYLIRLAKEHAGEIHLLITDVVMPEMNGRDLAKNLLGLFPEIKRLFMSGYTANVIAHHGVLDEGVQFLQKPFSPAELAAKVREALDSG